MMIASMLLGVACAKPPEVPEMREDDPGELPFQVGPSGFVQVDDTPGVRRFSSPPGSACMVEVRWWRPRPSTTGGPMKVEQTRKVPVLGEEREVSRTSMFQGAEKAVDVVMIPGDGVHTRLVFTDCGAAEIDGFLGTLGK